jgi:SAM-dependent methyltransferase
MHSSGRAVWQQEHVVDVREAAYAVRTYLEQKDLRAFLGKVAATKHIRVACEVGAGYGRMCMVLSEFADQVVGVEREPHFIGQARQLLPGVRFVQTGSLEQLPVRSGSVDLVLTFTVLQHLVDPMVAVTAGEITRILKRGGHLLICEETDGQLRAGAVDDPGGMCTIGRPVPVYQRLFAELDLLKTGPRRIEPTYPRPDVGTYMLFRKPGWWSQLIRSRRRT